MKIYKSSFFKFIRFRSKKKLHLFLSIIVISNPSYVFSSEINGTFIPQGKFDSALPTVTMLLDQNHPPVIRIAPSRPTIVIFPIQVSNCYSDNAALSTEIANPTKLSANEQGVNFSAVVFKVIGKEIRDGKIPDQTAVSCQLVNSIVYPIGVDFTDTNAYSVVKLLDKPLSTSSFSFDMDGYTAIHIGENTSKIRNNKFKMERNINKDQDSPKNLIPIRKKKRSMDELMKENYPQLKKENSIMVDNKDTIAELLEKKGFKVLKGELNASN